VCDNVYALLGDGSLRHMPGGVEQYLALRAPEDVPPPRAERAPPAQAVVRAARKEIARLERALEKLEARETTLHEQMAEAATDHVRLRELQSELAAATAERERLESAWLETSETLEA
jgi:ATP-binding cassette subfamily F protein uup